MERCKRSAASLVESAHVEALASLLRPFSPPTITFGEDAATETARDYYSGEAKPSKVEAVELRLVQNGITAEQIRAKAMHLCYAFTKRRRSSVKSDTERERCRFAFAGTNPI